MLTKRKGKGSAWRERDEKKPQRGAEKVLLKGESEKRKNMECEVPKYQEKPLRMYAQLLTFANRIKQ